MVVQRERLGRRRSRARPFGLGGGTAAPPSTGLLAALSQSATIMCSFGPNAHLALQHLRYSSVDGHRPAAHVLCTTFAAETRTVGTLRRESHVVQALANLKAFKSIMEADAANFQS